MLSVELSSCCSCDVFRQYFAVKRGKYSAIVPPFCSNNQNNSTSSPGFPGQRFNNLQPGCTFDVILTSSAQYDKILSKFGQQQLVMVNYACGFNQSETGKYFEWIIMVNSYLWLCILFLLQFQWLLHQQHFLGYQHMNLKVLSHSLRTKFKFFATHRYKY